MSPATNALIRSLMEHIGPPIAQVMQAPITGSRGQFSVILSIIVNTCVFTLADDEWQAIRAQAATPCGKPDCDCETLHVPLFDAIDKIRQHHAAKWEEMHPGQPLPGR